MQEAEGREQDGAEGAAPRRPGLHERAHRAMAGTALLHHAALRENPPTSITPPSTTWDDTARVVADAIRAS